uniref:hydroxyacid oxidase 1-like isoform X2 n=1 Tax=Styela clava TaxID=7725 RepID=UPI00193ACB96|nr:hydroxyacid oxidase 1-like isoform X2 [Styela clava]
MYEQLKCVEDFAKLASQKIPPENLAFYNGGAVGHETVKENCEAYKKWKFRPRLLKDVSEVDTSTMVLGSKIPFPICIAPTAFHYLATPNAEISTAQAAEAVCTGYIQSSVSTKTYEEISTKVPGCLRWCHLQFFKNRELVEHLVSRAEKCGFTGFVVTIDQAVLGKRIYRTPDGKHAVTSHLQPINMTESWKAIGKKDPFIVDKSFDDRAQWDSLDWLKSITKLPMVVKGILTEEMALEAIKHNVYGIIVSNHGGRQIDGTFSTIDSLPEVVKAVNGRCDVYLDGGIRKGTDVAKAIALGAKAVFVGRPILWGLACDGKTGAQRVLEILRDEFTLTMQQLGVTSIKELQSTPNLVVHESFVLRKRLNEEFNLKQHNFWH